MKPPEPGEGYVRFVFYNEETGKITQVGIIPELSLKLQIPYAGHALLRLDDMKLAPMVLISDYQVDLVAKALMRKPGKVTDGGI